MSLVYVGEETPLVRDYVDAMDTTAWTVFGESGWPDAEGLTPNKDAVSFLIETLKATPDVTILALGPMTNLAKSSPAHQVPDKPDGSCLHGRKL